MKKVIILFFLISLFLMGQDYNIGDNIQLRIKGISREEIEKAFSSLEIKDIKQEKDGYEVSVTTYKPGKYEIDLNNKNLIIDVKSSISPEEKEIYLDFKDKINKFQFKDYPYLVIVSGLFSFACLTGLIVSVIYEKLISPEYKFRKKLKKINQENWKIELSLALREYIDRLYNSRFLQGDYEEIGELTKDDIELIKNMDYLKFSKKSSANYEEYRNNILKIFEKINKEKKKNV